MEQKHVVLKLRKDLEATKLLLKVANEYNEKNQKFFEDFNFDHLDNIQTKPVKVGAKFE